VLGLCDLVDSSAGTVASAKLVLELESHLQMHIEDNARAGMRRAKKRGAMHSSSSVGLEQTREKYRGAEKPSFARYTCAGLSLWRARMLLKNPGFTVICRAHSRSRRGGANAAIFSVVHAVLFKTTALSGIRSPGDGSGRESPCRIIRTMRTIPSPGNFSDWKSQNTVFENIGVYRNRSFLISPGAGEPVARRRRASFRRPVFPFCKTNAALGRLFTTEDDQPGGRHIIVLSDGLLEEPLRFENAQILGKTILLDGEGYSVVGVMPPDFHFPDPDDQLWVPIALTPQDLANHGKPQSARHRRGSNGM